MGIISRFFGRKDADSLVSSPLVANPQLKDPLSLELLFLQPPELDNQRLSEALYKTDKSLSKAMVELDSELTAQGTPLGLIGWGKHVVQLVGFSAPMPSEALERCLEPSHYGAEQKELARSHQAYIILYYAGYETEPLEQYVALGLVAGALARLGAVTVVNETAHTTLPAAIFTDDAFDLDLSSFLREGLPLLMLFCGFVKYEVEGVQGVWMRTYGVYHLGQPDLALLADGHQQGQQTMDMFSNILSYLIESKAQIAADHTMQIGENAYLRLRLPQENEYFLDSKGDIFVSEIISADEINQP